MSKHSPGPWRWKENLDQDEEPTLLDANGETVCHFGLSTQYYPTEGEGPGPADARLIAAAPELLEALRKAVARCERMLAGYRIGEPAVCVCRDCRDARKLIARIEGETK